MTSSTDPVPGHSVGPDQELPRHFESIGAFCEHDINRGAASPGWLLIERRSRPVAMRSGAGCRRIGTIRSRCGPPTCRSSKNTKQADKRLNEIEALVKKAP
jgi:hypothetical protein